MPLTHRLTVDGRDYFLPDPVDHLKSQVLDAVRHGGGYVHIPPIRGGYGLDILFSPGVNVVWSAIESPEESSLDGESFTDFAAFSDFD